jgi:uncharacterized phiE125 gp8 family phage protein
MNIITLTEPTQEPVSLAQVYEHLRLTPDVGSPPSHPDDDMLMRQIKTARADCEKRTRRAFVKQKLRLIVDPQSRWWPWSVGGWEWNRPRGNRNCTIELKRPPVVQVTQVSYFDSANALVNVDPSNYFVTDDEPARIQFVNGFHVGDAYRRADALRIDYWAGYPFDDSPEDLVGNVPAPIVAAILLGIELQYDSVSTDQRTALYAAQTALLSSFVVQLAI